MESIWLDIRYGLRVFKNSPGFAFVAVLVLALGIGANTAVFSIINATLLRSAPFVKEPDRLVRLSNSEFGPVFSYPAYRELAEKSTVFSGLVSFARAPLSLGGEGEPERVSGLIVSGNYFATLGVDARQGRLLTTEDDRVRGGHAVAVLGYGIWQRRFGGADVTGRSVKLNGHAFTIVGVAPEGFNGAETRSRVDVFVPRMMEGEISQRAKSALDDWREPAVTLVGRLNPGVSVGQAKAEMETLAAQVAAKNPSGEAAGIDVSGWVTSPSITEDLIGASAVMIVVTLVLVIACANVANLLLARAGTRRKEVAVRLVLGVGRLRLVRQLLTESCLLSLAAGAIGLLVTLWVIDLVWVWVSANTESTFMPGVSLDWRVLGYTLALSFFTGIVFGLVPALQASKSDLVTALKEGGPTIGYRRSKLRSTLVISQIAVSLVLLVIASLFIKSWYNTRASKAVADSDRVIVISVAPGEQRYTRQKAKEFYRSLIENVGRVPGVESASLVNSINISGVEGDVTATVEGVAGNRSGGRVSHYTVAPGYFRTLGFPVVQGRDFTREETEGAPLAVIVNQSMARRSWPGEDPLGKRVRVESYVERNAPLLEVVGVVEDANDRNAFGKRQPTLYVPLFQSYSPEMTVVARTSVDAKGLIAAVKREVTELDRDMAVFGEKTLGEHISYLLATERQVSSFVTVAGLLALALASIGLYGVVSYSASQRTHEIGVRLALGARPSDVLKLVLTEGLFLALGGIAVGLGLAFVAAQIISSALYGVGAMDPGIYLVISLVLAAVALTASYLPARRATRVDPMVALRYE
ncbi:MAG TPA: ABC transporter permease [Blastocatellia bacterium]|nr:ABC transporter permease [Blastocatellia bacterium]